MCKVVFLAPLLRTFFRLILVSAAFCVSSGAFAATSTVSVVSFAFNPSNSVINAGDTITWKNNSTFVHDTTHLGTPSLWGAPAATMAAGGGSFSFTFANAGTYPYRCQTHAVTAPQQRGNIIVNNVNVNKPPFVSLTDPTSNQHFFAPATFTLRATATDELAVDIEIAAAGHRSLLLGVT